MKKYLFLILCLFSFNLWATNLHYLPIKSKSISRKSHGSYTQRSWLLGNYQLELVLGETYGRAIIGHRFNWSWKKDWSFFGLLGGGMNVEELGEHPDLLERFYSLKPEYIKFKVNLVHSKDLLQRASNYAESNIIVEAFGDQIRSAAPDAHNLKSYQSFSFKSPQWIDFASYTKNEFSTQDLRYIGLNKYRKNVSLDDSRAIATELIYSYYTKTELRAIELMEIRWPDKEIQQIFREFSRREYKKLARKIKKVSRDELANEINKNANDQLFWNSANINLEDYETTDSTQTLRLKYTLKKTVEKFNRESELFAKVAERANYSNYSDFRSRILKSFDGHKLNPLVDTDIKDHALTHNVKMNAKVLAENNHLKRVNVYMNDVLKFRAKKSGRNFNTVLIYNYDWNEVKVGLEYKDGMELVDRFYTLREGEKVPLRATLVWDFDDNEYEKSDIDLALSRKDNCYNDSIIVSHEKKTLTEGSSKYILDVDNTSGFGPENISIYDNSGEKYFRFCLQNYTSKVEARAKVIIFKNEEIIPINSNDYLYEVDFDSSSKRKWILVPGTYVSPRF